MRQIEGPEQGCEPRREHPLIVQRRGTALVIHSKADDMKTDTAGNSGDRTACGMVKK